MDDGGEPDFPDYITVKRSARARRVGLRLDTKARRFDLVVPKWMSLSRAQDFALDQEDWMQEQLAALPAGVPFVHGSVLPLLGRDYRIEIVPHKARRTEIELEDGVLYVRTHMDDPSMRIKRWLKDFALEEMERLVHDKAAMLKKKVRDVTMRDPKSRWGSCSSDKRIMLSWRLILAPYDAMDYVIAHEVAHLKHMDHSAKFWAQCEVLCDDYKSGKSWMRKHAQGLMAYGVY